MDGFEGSLEECKAEMERLSRESAELTERMLELLDSHDGDTAALRRRCRTVNTSVNGVLEEVSKRLDRYRAGDLPELPSVLELAIECCERLDDTAEMIQAGKPEGRRDLKGQISSNIVYLAHHLDSMDEDGYLTETHPSFADLFALSERIQADDVALEELTAFACESIGPIHTYLRELRENEFWEPEKE